MKGKILASVTDKSGLPEFMKVLVELGGEILSTGGTAKNIKGAGLPVTEVADYTGFTEMLGGRVKTLNPKIHAGILARRNNPGDQADMARQKFDFINIVICNLYDVKTAIAEKGDDTDAVMDETDIGGVAMLRGAAKNFKDVIVVCDPADYGWVAEKLKANGDLSEDQRRRLAQKVFRLTSEYDGAIARYLSGGKCFSLFGEQFAVCKYGENAHQIPAMVFSTDSGDPLGLDKLNLVAGTEPSSNNYCDMDSLLQTITHVAANFDVNRNRVPLIAVSVKHKNACGAALGYSPMEVIQKMVDGDHIAIFGGFLMLNFPVTAEIAEAILTHGMPEGQRRLLDGIVAPSFSAETIDRLRRKNDKCRLLANPALEHLDRNSLDTSTRFRHLRGGFSTQPNYLFIPDFNDPDLKKYGQATVDEEDDMLLAIGVCHTSSSNTITMARNGMLIGNGVGQQARVYGAKLSLERARTGGHKVAGAVAASDSFFPEIDGIQTLTEAGVSAVFATSGSVRDKEVIAYAEKEGVALYMIPDKKGRGFFGH